MAHEWEPNVCVTLFSMLPGFLSLLQKYFGVRDVGSVYAILYLARMDKLALITRVSGTDTTGNSALTFNIAQIH